MSDIFISYAREDLDKVKPIVRLLEQRRWSVWWDRNIPAGQAFDEVIEKELEVAHCVIVIWSKTSVQSRWVKNEASEGMDRNILVPIIIDDGLKIPLEFKKLHSLNLFKWDGKSIHPEIEALLTSIAVIVNKNSWKPPVDLIAEDGRYIMAMELPGISPDELEIIIESSFLTIEGIRRVPFLADPDKYIIAERKASRFYREIPLPENIEGWSLRRDYRDGVLILILSGPE